MENSPLKISVYTSTDGKIFDTVPYETFTLAIEDGKEVRQTFRGNICSCFIRIVAENSSDLPIDNVRVDITLKN